MTPVNYGNDTCSHFCVAAEKDAILKRTVAWFIYSCLSLIPHINQKIQVIVVMMAMVKGNQKATIAQRE